LLEKDWKFYNPNEDLNNFLPADWEENQAVVDDDLPF
jgi:hypothetical protein